MTQGVLPLSVAYRGVDVFSTYFLKGNNENPKIRKQATL
jgi:hypothetical protein